MTKMTKKDSLWQKKNKIIQNFIAVDAEDIEDLLERYHNKRRNFLFPIRRMNMTDKPKWAFGYEKENGAWD